MYVTEEEMAEKLGSDAPDNLDELIFLSYDLICEATSFAVYETTDELATDPKVAGAFKSAQTAQIKWWAKEGVDAARGASGVELIVTGQNFGGVNETVAGPTEALKQKIESLHTTLAPMAEAILRRAGLTEIN